MNDQELIRSLWICISVLIFLFSFALVAAIILFFEFRRAKEMLEIALDYIHKLEMPASKPEPESETSLPELLRIRAESHAMLTSDPEKALPEIREQMEKRFGVTVPPSEEGWMAGYSGVSFTNNIRTV